MLHTAKQVSPAGVWNVIRDWFIRRSGQPLRMFSEIDYYRLQGLLTNEHLETFASLARQLRQLRGLLRRGMLYPCKAIPNNLVTMNSVVLLRSRRGTAFRIGLVYPKDADPRQRKVSVLSRLGLVLIGRMEGDCVSRNLVIEKILYQPERMGNYYV